VSTVQSLLINAYINGTLLTTLKQEQETGVVPHEGLHQEEVKVLTFLKGRLKEEGK
jgi:hypothetical protein